MTRPERMAWGALWRRYGRAVERHVRGLPGTPDFALRALRLAIFVHGCFWHSCAACERPLPSTNALFWAAKLARNQRRDAGAETMLAIMGWRVVIVWEHDLRTPADGERFAASLPLA